MYTFSKEFSCFKVAQNLVFPSLTNLESKLIVFYAFINFYQTVSFESHQPFTVRKIGSFLSTLASVFFLYSNNAHT